MKNLLIALLCLAVSKVANGSDIIRSEKFVAEDIGFKKWIPQFRDDKGAWIITCKVLDGNKVIDHRSFAYFESKYALERAWVLMADPSALGVDFEGRIVRFRNHSIKLPGFRDGTVSLESPAPNRRILIIASAFAGRHRIEYAIENLPVEDIEKIAGTKKFANGNVVMEAPVHPARQTVLLSEQSKQENDKEAEEAAPSDGDKPSK